MLHLRLNSTLNTANQPHEKTKNEILYAAVQQTKGAPYIKITTKNTWPLTAKTNDKK